MVFDDLRDKEKIFAFDDFVINAAERLVLKNGKRVKLYPKAFELLILLIEKSGSVVTKSEIFNRVWAQKIVEEVNLTVQISRLRKLLGKDCPIETVTGVGYRFNSSIEMIRDQEWQKLIAPVRSIEDPTEFTGDRRSDYLNKSDSNADLVAVLPFDNLTENLELDFLADGLTEHLIEQLSRKSNLRLLARSTVFRYRDRTDDLDTIVSELRAGRILKGSLQLHDNTLNVKVELIRASDRTHLWDGLFQEAFTNIFELQEKMAQAISEELQAKIKKGIQKNPFRNKPVNFESYQLYFKACYLLNRRSLTNINKAIEFLIESIALDKNNALARLKLINAYISLYQYDEISYREIKPIVLNLLDKLNKSAEETDDLFLTLALVEREVNWNLKRAEFYLKKAAEINENSVDLQYSFMNILICTGRLDEAWKKTDKILELDPLSGRCVKQRARLLMFQGENESALKQLRGHLEIEPHDVESMALLGWVYLEMRDFDRSLEAFDKSIEIQWVPELLAMKGLILAEMGNGDEAREILKQLEATEKLKLGTLVYRSYILLALGEIEKSLDCLNQAFENHQSDVLRIKVDIRFKELWPDPRFKRLLEKIGVAG